MFYLVTSLRVTANRYISLRDYDFVGEDKQLAAELAARMAPLKAPLKLLNDEPGRAARRPPAPLQDADYRLEPDYLQHNLGLPDLVNVSSDYAELFNATELEFEVAPELGRAAAGPEDRAAAGPEDLDARRTYKDPKYIWPNNTMNNKKILDLMRQTIYSAHRKIYEIQPTIKKYESDVRFRIPYIFRKLDEWKRDMRTILFAMNIGVSPPPWKINGKRYSRWRALKMMWYYEHALRLNVDITYSVEHLLFLHSDYMKEMNAMVRGRTN